MPSRNLDTASLIGAKFMEYLYDPQIQIKNKFNVCSHLHAPATLSAVKEPLHIFNGVKHNNLVQNQTL
jgi:hypothetical protein